MWDNLGRGDTHTRHLLLCERRLGMRDHLYRSVPRVFFEDDRVFTVFHRLYCMLLLGHHWHHWRRQVLHLLRNDIGGRQLSWHYSLLDCLTSILRLGALNDLEPASAIQLLALDRIMNDRGRLWSIDQFVSIKLLLQVFPLLR